MLDLDPDIQKLITRAIRQAHRKGKEQGHATGRTEVLAGLKAIAGIAGVDGTTTPTIRKAIPWSEDDHPRDKDGRWIEKGDLAYAHRNPEFRKKLEASVHPEDRHKLDRAIEYAGTGKLNYTETPDEREEYDSRPPKAAQPATPEAKKAAAELDKLTGQTEALPTVGNAQDGQLGTVPSSKSGQVEDSSTSDGEDKLSGLMATLLERAKTDKTIRKILEDHVHPDDRDTLARMIDGEPVKSDPGPPVPQVPIGEGAPATPLPEPKPEPKKDEVNPEAKRADLLMNAVHKDPKAWSDFETVRSKMVERFYAEPDAAEALARHMAKGDASAPEHLDTLASSCNYIAKRTVMAAAKAMQFKKDLEMTAKNPAVGDHYKELTNKIGKMETPDAHLAAWKAGTYRQHLEQIKKLQNQADQMSIKHGYLGRLHGYSDRSQSLDAKKAVAKHYLEELDHNTDPLKAVGDYASKGGTVEGMYHHLKPLAPGEQPGRNSVYNRLTPYAAGPGFASDQGMTAVVGAMKEHLNQRKADATTAETGRNANMTKLKESGQPGGSADMTDRSASADVPGGRDEDVVKGPEEKPATAAGQPDGGETGGAKEPWQMTADKYKDRHLPKKITYLYGKDTYSFRKELERSGLQFNSKLKGWVGDNIAIKEFNRKYPKAKVYEQQTDVSNAPSVALDYADYLHRRVVEQALAAGKPVPAEVLADYPDLAGKAKADNAATPAPQPWTPPDIKPHGKPVEARMAALTSSLVDPATGKHPYWKEYTPEKEATLVPAYQWIDGLHAKGGRWDGKANAIVMPDGTKHELDDHGSFTYAKYLANGGPTITGAANKDEIVKELDSSIANTTYEREKAKRAAAGFDKRSKGYTQNRLSADNEDLAGQLGFHIRHKLMEKARQTGKTYKEVEGEWLANKKAGKYDRGAASLNAEPGEGAAPTAPVASAKRVAKPRVAKPKVENTVVVPSATAVTSEIVPVTANEASESARTTPRLGTPERDKLEDDADRDRAMQKTYDVASVQHEREAEKQREEDAKAQRLAEINKFNPHSEEYTAKVPTPKSMSNDMFSNRHSFGKMLQDTGMYSNGAILLKLPEKEKAKILGKEPITEGRYPDLSSIMAEPKGKSTFKAVHAGSRIQVLGNGKNSKRKTNDVRHDYLMQSEDGKQQIVVDGKYIEMIKKHYPDATFIGVKDGNGSGQIRAYHNGNYIGTVMPIIDEGAGKYKVKA